ncbi:hypothetical protein IW262DRAFT_341553 [Armillaria fumosa]|nr:hypothetical protein IW262DRAFT_341553 [Armillaria fumosa]
MQGGASIITNDALNRICRHPPSLHKLSTSIQTCDLGCTCKLGCWDRRDISPKWDHNRRSAVKSVHRRLSLNLCGRGAANLAAQNMCQLQHTVHCSSFGNTTVHSRLTSSSWSTRCANHGTWDASFENASIVLSITTSPHSPRYLVTTPSYAQMQHTDYPDPSQGVKGAHIHDTNNSSFFPFYAISTFSPSLSPRSRCPSTTNSMPLFTPAIQANDIPAPTVADNISSKALPLPKEVAEDLLNGNQNRWF